MKLRRPSLVYASIMAASVGVFMAGAHLAANALIEAQRLKQLHGLNEVALRRSEVVVDSGINALNETMKQGPMSCNAAALQAVRLLVYQRSAVKDIRAVDQHGSVLCSAYSETLEFDKRWVHRTEMLPAGDDAVVRLFRVDQFYGVALGVQKDVDAKNGVVAILGMNANLLDIMPTELRDHSEVLLELTDGQVLADFLTTEQHSRASRILSFSMASARYPVRTVIRVEAKTFAEWDRESYLPILSLSVALGLAFGFLLARAVLRPKNPIAELDRALAAGEFRPYLQPVFNLCSCAIVGCEVLARWKHADGTLIPPLRFIPLAESSGRIERLTWQILSVALNELQPRLKQDQDFQIYVNIVPRHFVAPYFVEHLRRAVADAKVSPRQVVLEITEREELEDLSLAASVIAELRGYGFKVAIDDVGVGHSGLSQVQRLGANILKIDKFFVDSIGRDSTANAVVRMLVQLARELKMGVHAEGIETDEQISALIACGVEEGQGYVVSRPLPVAEFIEFLELRSERAATVGTLKPARVA
jgi:sensor c-di-GMP phosphodiesterase-like protein